MTVFDDSYPARLSVCVPETSFEYEPSVEKLAPPSRDTSTT